MTSSVYMPYSAARGAWLAPSPVVESAISAHGIPVYVSPAAEVPAPV
jgi:hypothetical protein